MTYTVELSARAEADIREAYRYIQDHGPANAETWQAGLYEKLALLESFPESCGFAPENEHSQVQIRPLLYGPFRILFAIRSRHVYVIAFRHRARRFLASDEITPP